MNRLLSSEWWIVVIEFILCAVGLIWLVAKAAPTIPPDDKRVITPDYIWNYFNQNQESSPLELGSELGISTDNIITLLIHWAVGDRNKFDQAVQDMFK